MVHSADGAATQLRCASGETLLEAGLREGLALPYECRNGGCGVCLCSVEHGARRIRPYQRSALPDALKAQGKALMCCAMPLGDVVIEVEGPGARRRRARPSCTPAESSRLERLAEDVMRRADRAARKASAIAFTAGQYINILLDDGAAARVLVRQSRRTRTSSIELHVRRIPGGRFTGHVFEGMRVGDTLRFEGPLGSFTLNESARPILFVAGATGFAPVKSIIEDAFHRGLQRPMRLYWGVRRRAGPLHARSGANAGSASTRISSWCRCSRDPSPETNGTAAPASCTRPCWPTSDLGGHEVYVCGSLRMVEAAVPAFIAQGLSEDACFSDAFLPQTPTGGWGLEAGGREGSGRSDAMQ